MLTYIKIETSSVAMGIDTQRRRLNSRTVCLAGRRRKKTPEKKKRKKVSFASLSESFSIKTIWNTVDASIEKDYEKY